ncbi:TPA: ead/Ea22-like family protein [Pseudomonas aeruginosa]
MTDTKKLKELAERATPGPWSAAWEEGDDTAWPNLFPVIQAGNGEVVIGNEGFYTDLEQDKANATFCAAANPQAILGLIDEVERLEEELSQCASALPGTYYMDPPDGGNVSIPEQIRRMAKDAARYRWLRGASHFDTPQHQAFCKAYGDALDYEIDAAIEGAKQ